MIMTSTNGINHHIYSLIFLSLSDLKTSSFSFVGKLLLVRGTLLYVSFATGRSSAGRNASRNGDKNGSGDKSEYSEKDTYRNRDRNGNRSTNRNEVGNGNGDGNGDNCGDDGEAQTVVVNFGASEDGVEVDEVEGEVREKVEAGEEAEVLGEEEEDAFMQALISVTRPSNKVLYSSNNHCRSKTEAGMVTETKAKSKTKTDGQHSSKKRRRDDGVDAGAGAEGGVEGGAAGYAGGCAVSVRYKEVRFIIGPPR